MEGPSELPWSWSPTRHGVIRLTLMSGWKFLVVDPVLPETQETRPGRGQDSAKASRRSNRHSKQTSDSVNKLGVHALLAVCAQLEGIVPSLSYG